MSQFQISAFSDEYADSFQEQLEALKRFRIAYVELRMVNGKNLSLCSSEEISEMKRLLDDYGIGVSAIGSPLGKIHLDEDLNAHYALAEHVLDAANRLGAKFIRIFSFYPSRGKEIAEQKGEVIEALSRLLILAEKHGVVLCHENEAEIYGSTPERCRALLDEFGGALGCVFDMGNFVLEGVNPFEAYQMLKDYVSYFHVKDALFTGAIVPPGKGEAEILKILNAHREYSKEDFFVTLEPHLQLKGQLQTLVGRAFENPYQYGDAKSAFEDAVIQFRKLI